MKKHLKRLPAPRSWSIQRKSAFWTTRPAPGPHSAEGSIPLRVILRDMLHLCDNAREAQSILNARGVLVDGRVVTNPKFAVGLMDVLTLAEGKVHYRMTIDSRGRLTLVPAEAAESSWKLCRIEGKTTTRGGQTQLNLHDGRNILLPKNQYKVGSTLKVRVPSQEILGAFELEADAASLITGGQHVGEIAHVEEVHRTRNPRANVVSFKEGFTTDITKVFVVGREAPEIRMPEAPAI